MYRLDLQTLNWDQVGTRAAPDQPDSLPACIDEHTACLDGGNKVIVFGGFNDGERVNLIRQFDLELHQWRIIAPANQSAPKPRARAGHAAVIHENCLYVFGGKDDENAKLNDLWKFDMASLTWT